MQHSQYILKWPTSQSPQSFQGHVGEVANMPLDQTRKKTFFVLLGCHRVWYAQLIKCFILHMVGVRVGSWLELRPGYALNSQVHKMCCLTKAKVFTATLNAGCKVCHHINCLHSSHLASRCVECLGGLLVTESYKYSERCARRGFQMPFDV